jgi:hypothetical protein
VAPGAQTDTAIGVKPSWSKTIGDSPIQDVVRRCPEPAEEVRPGEWHKKGTQTIFRSLLEAFSATNPLLRMGEVFTFGRELEVLGQGMS